MKGLRTLIRVRRRQLDEKRRELKDLEHLAAELNGRLASLATELRDEQVQARESVEVGFSYGGYAQAVITRRENIEESLVAVGQQVADAREEVRIAFQELKRYEMTLESRERVAIARRAQREQRAMDELALDRHRRGDPV